MELTRWNPWREIEDVTSRLNAMFRTRDDRRDFGRLGMPDWSPAVDIKENQEEYLITAELPGVNKKDVKVTMRNNVLALEGTKQTETKSESETMHRMERFYGTFHRSFVLPEGTNEQKIQANFNDGLLIVHIPKVQPSPIETKEIPVG